MKTVLVLITCAAAALVIACGGNSDADASATSPPTRPAEASATPPPSPTSAPPTAVPTAVPTEAPTEAPAAAPTQPPAQTGGGGPGGRPGGGGGGAGSRAVVVAQNLVFTNRAVTARAGNVTLVLENRDLLVAHDIRVDGLAGSASCTGVCETSASFSAGPGTYRFVCTIHPEMTGSITLVP